VSVLSPEVLALVLIGTLVAVVAVLFWMLNVRMRDFRNDEPVRKLPCAHRFVRVRYRVDADGVAGKPEPVCGDCGQPVGNVRLRIADDHELEPGEKGVGIVYRKKDPMEED
jgi:hypothetical protein